MNDTSAEINNWFDTYLKPNLITSKICYQSASCWTKNGTFLLSGTKKSDSNPSGIGTPTVTAVLNDGTYIDVDRTTCSQFSIGTNHQYCVAIYFDINGDKKPNTLGKDIFATVFTEDGLVPAGRALKQTSIKQACSDPKSGLHCIMQYLEKY